MTDEFYMRLAVAAARKAEGLTHPNPAVGAVIVNGAKVVGIGYHKRCGMPHAEAEALRDAGARARGAKMYVTLEPCCHFGRTPPCADAVIDSGIREVVIAMKDPNPINNGKGIAKLRAHGVKTSVGILEDEARAMNRPYLKLITKKMPYVTVKVAQSLDGRIATRSGDSRWITSRASRRYVHALRGRVDAVMVGFRTLIKDDPLLTDRVSGRRQPARIVLDSRLETPPSAKIFRDIDKAPVVIAAAAKSAAKAKNYEKRGVRILFVRNKKGRLDLKDLFVKLGRMGMAHILVEGGGELIGALVDECLVDRFLIFVAPKIIGGRDATSSVMGRGVGRVSDSVALANIEIKRFSEDILITGEVR